jgi:hypothetical protein
MVKIGIVRIVTKNVPVLIVKCVAMNVILIWNISRISSKRRWTKRLKNKKKIKSKETPHSINKDDEWI